MVNFKALIIFIDMVNFKAFISTSLTYDVSWTGIYTFSPINASALNLQLPYLWKLTLFVENHSN